MLNALKSASKNPTLRLAAKTAIVLATLFFVGNFWWSAVLFLAVSFYFYRRGGTSDISLLYSFAVFLAIILISRWLLAQNWFFGLSIILASLSFFLMLGFKNLLFLKRAFFYNILNNLLFLLAFLMFFFLANQDFFWLRYLAVTAAGYFLFKEFFLLYPMFLEGRAQIMPVSSKKATLLSFSFAFLVSQFFWVNSLLPIGFLNSSAVLMVIVLIFKDLTSNYLNGLLDKRVVLKNITIFIIFTLIIFAASKWSL